MLREESLEDAYRCSTSVLKSNAVFLQWKKVS